MTGYAVEDIKGKSARVLYPDEEEFERAGREKYAEIEARGKGAVETRWRRKRWHPIRCPPELRPH